MITRRTALSLLAPLAAASAAVPARAAGLPIFGRRHDGRDARPEDFPEWRLVYFGYTHCPDVCPLGLQTMADAIEALGPLGAHVSPIFVTVDPARDTPAVMTDYVGFFHPRLVGITPSEEELRVMGKAWRVKYAKVEVGEGRPYLMDHTASLLLSDPAGEAAGRLSHDLGGARTAERVRNAMEARS